MAPSELRVRAPHLVLLLVLAAAGILRWHHLGRESAWLDEAYSIDLAGKSAARILAEGWVDIHPPLYYLALHAWTALAGSTEAGARLLSVLCDVGTVAIAFSLTRRIAGAWTAVLAAVLLAVSPFHVEFAQEARMYALLGLCSAWSMSSFLRLIAQPGVRTSVPYVVATAALAYTHVYAVFVIVSQGLTAAWWMARADRTDWRRPLTWWAGSLCGAALLYAPWMVVMIDQVTRVRASFWIARPAWLDGVTILGTFSGSAVLGWAIGVLALIGVVAARRPAAARGLSAAGVLVPWLVAPIVLPLIVSRVATPIFLPKYAIAASIPLAILAALGVARLRPAGVRAPVAVALVLLTMPPLANFYTTRRREGWREAVARLESLAEPGDLVLFYPWFNQYPYDYYRARHDLIERGFPLAPGVAVPDPESLAALVKDAVDGARRVWLVVLQGDPQREPIARGLARVRPQLRHIVEAWLELDLFGPSP